MRGPLVPPTILTPWAVEAIGLQLDVLSADSLWGTASAVYPSANLAIYIPFSVSTPITVVKLFSVNGATVSGNIDVGINDPTGVRIISSGSTLQSGTNAVQEFDIADTLIGPGEFFLAVAMNNVTGTLFRGTVSATTVIGASTGMYQQATAFALPATATFARYAQNYIPVIGLSQSTVI